MRRPPVDLFPELGEHRQSFTPISLPLAPALTYILKDLQKSQVLDNDLETSEERIKQSANRLGYTINSEERDTLLAYLDREQKPFGILQELVDDLQVNDIVIRRFDQITVQKHRKNYSTDLSFASHEAYKSFVEKLLALAGCSYSTKLPITDGMIANQARIHAVHESLCEGGPYLTIRLNRHSEIALADLHALGLAPFEVLDYIAALIASGNTVLVSGEVGTGKTTLTRALGASIANEESILVIEDTPEIKLQHPEVRYLRTRVANTEGAGRVSPSECIRAGMRMAMNRIIFGEIRDPEAAEAFIDVCASGHPGLSTLHAKSASDAARRLELFLGRAQRGAEKSVLGSQIANALAAIIQIDVCKVSGKRRIVEVKEIDSYVENILQQKTIFKYSHTASAPVWEVKSVLSNYEQDFQQLSRPYHLNQLNYQLNLQGNNLVQEAA